MLLGETSASDEGDTEDSEDSVPHCLRDSRGQEGPQGGLGWVHLPYGPGVSAVVADLPAEQRDSPNHHEVLPSAV